MDQSQVFRAMMPGLTSANGARIAVAYPSFPRPLPLVRLDRRAVFRAAGAAPLVCGLPRAATLLVADEPLCSLRLVIRDIAPAGEGRHDLTMQPSGAAGDELPGTRCVIAATARFSSRLRPSTRPSPLTATRTRRPAKPRRAVAQRGLPAAVPQRRAVLCRLARISLRRTLCAVATAWTATAAQPARAAGGRRRGRRALRLRHRWPCDAARADRLRARGLCMD